MKGIRHKVKEVKWLTFSFDNLDMLTMIDEDVYVRGMKNTDSECVLIMSENLFHKALSRWLRHKEYWFSKKKKFCGEGFVYCGRFMEIGEIKILKKFFLKRSEDNGIPKYIFVPLFKVSSTGVCMDVYGED